MGVTLDDELAALRARAYGADADIRDDPEALARLRALEDEERTKRATRPPLPSSIPDRPPLPGPTPEAATAPVSAHGPASVPRGVTVTVVPVPDGSGRARTAGDSGAPDAGAAEPPAAGPDADTRSRRWPRGRVLVACALTALVTAAVAVPTTLWAAGSADRPYAVLEPTVGIPNGVFFSPESNPLRYEDFLGLEISVGGLDYRAGERCILIDLDPQPAEYSENTRGACSPAGFGAVVDIPVVEIAQSAETREALADITALRFELVGDEIHVFAARVPDDSEDS